MSYGGRAAGLHTLALESIANRIERKLIMNRFQRIRRSAAVLAGLAGSLLVFVTATPAAFARPLPPDPGDAGLVQTPRPPSRSMPWSPAACPAGRSS
jgi:hypothetical protein